MGGVVGKLVSGVITGGLDVFEHLVLQPTRLGTQLAIGHAGARAADPVVLVAGFANSPSGWNEWVRSLRADGFDVHVFDLPSRGLGDMRESARLLAEFVEGVRKRTGRKLVDVVGFSEGGLLARLAASGYGAASGIDRLVSLATPHGGIGIASGLYHARTPLSSAVDSWMPALGQLMEGHALLGEIERGDAAARAARTGVRYASIYSRSPDPVVRPTAAWLAGAVNIPVSGDGPGDRDPSHFTMYHQSDRAYEAARSSSSTAPTPTPSPPAPPPSADRRRGEATSPSPSPSPASEFFTHSGRNSPVPDARPRRTKGTSEFFTQSGRNSEVALATGSIRRWRYSG